MCGIAGVWGDVDESRLWRAVRTLRHRGPDDEGIWTAPGGGVGIGTCRLSVIDVAGGHQPMGNEDGSIWTVVNGEIYNYRELRDGLLARGHRFATQSDTETVVHLYEQVGLDFPQYLRGMFGVAVWDERLRQLVLARDRLGKKPLYYSEAHGEFCFGSEIKAVVAVHGPRLTIDDQALVDYLAWSAVPAPATIYREIRTLPAATCMVVRDRRVVSQHAYWRLTVGPKREVRDDEAVDLIDAALREATRLRLRSDVPVGAFLSGGLDSGIVAAMAAQQYPGKLLTISPGFQQSAFDERPLARQVAERYGTDHHEVLVSPSTDVLPTVAAGFDQPYGNTSAIPSYYVAQAARQHLKVVLTGDGGDEILAGYRRYIAVRIASRLAWTDNAAGRIGWRALRHLLPTPQSFRTGYALGYRLVRGMAADPVNRYMLWGPDMIGASDLVALCDGTDWLRDTEPGERIAAALWQEYREAGHLDRMLAMDGRTTLIECLNLKLDICTMRHGLEARPPLLDHMVVDLVGRLPERIKLPGRETKPLLRRLAARYLPEDVQVAPKRGFEVPLLRWLQNDLKDLRNDILLSPSGLLAERFSRTALENLVYRRVAIEPSRWAQQVIALLMLGIWDRYVRPQAMSSGVASGAPGPGVAAPTSGR